MRRAALLLAGLAASTAACDPGEAIELLPPRDAGADAQPDAAPRPREFDICPTRIDVYGGANALFWGCGGPSMPSLPIQEGYFEPSEAAYDATLAGRLQARLEADPALTPLFGTSFRVRSCAGAADLAQLVPALKADACGFESPPAMGSLVDLCARDPAPVVIAAVDATMDRCHGGGPDAPRGDDQAGFAAHTFLRLDALRARRSAELLLIGPRPEWQPSGMPRPGTPDDASCLWARGDWNRAAVLGWGAASPSRPDIFMAVDPDDDRFRRHSRCCGKLGVPCETSWYVGARGNFLLNCDGAQAVVDFWYARLKRILVENHFKCP